jgi:putative restriction endonuclease
MPISDQQLRIRAFDWLSEVASTYGDEIPRSVLAAGFEFEGVRIPLVSPQGIFKPKIASLPLTIATTPNSPYNDSEPIEGVFSYQYRGTDPNHPDNVGLRQAMVSQTPLIYLYGITPGQYQAFWPVYVVGDSRETLTFSIAIDDVSSISNEASLSPQGLEARREYITVLAKRRLHQHKFRNFVIREYRTQCALCRLGHSNLLDAAHIIEDSHADGAAVIQNGISLCKLHHAAYDANLLGISADYKITIREDVLAEVDGPVLEHGIKALHGNLLFLPRQKNSWPDPDRLEYRFQKFRAAS